MSEQSQALHLGVSVCLEEQEQELLDIPNGIAVPEHKHKHKDEDEDEDEDEDKNKRD